MKTVVLVLVLIASVSIGVINRSKQYKKMNALSEIKKLMLHISRCVEFSSKPIGEILEELDIGEYPVLDNFLVVQKAIYRDGLSFSKAWRKSLESFNMNEKVFENDEMSVLTNFGNNFGNGDLDTQLNLLKMVIDYFDDFENNAKKTLEKKAKLNLLLPIYFGLVVCILFI